MKRPSTTLKQWLWFAGLWLAGAACVAVAAYTLRWLVYLVLKSQ